MHAYEYIRAWWIFLATKNIFVGVYDILVDVRSVVPTNLHVRELRTRGIIEEIVETVDGCVPNI